MNISGFSKTWEMFSTNIHTFPSTYKCPQILESLSHGLHFLNRFIQSPSTVGSIFPSSKVLAEKIVQYIPERSYGKEGKHYLEVGPGTGPFTQEIVKRLTSQDELDVVELDPTFCEILRKKYQDFHNVHIHCRSIANWSPEYRYDAIISGLPLNAFSPQDVQVFIDTFKILAKEGGTVSYFEYALLPKLKIKTLSGAEQAQFQKVLDIKNDFFKTFGFKSETVLLNFPPAKVLHFKMDKTHKAKQDATPAVPAVSNSH